MKKTAVIVAGGAGTRMGKDLPKQFLEINGKAILLHAIEAFKKLSKLHNVYILSTAPWDNPDAWTHKRLWVEKYLGAEAYKKLILSHNKHLCAGDYLIDDRTANGAGKFGGELLLFGSKDFPNWDAVLTHIKNNEK